MKKFIISTIAAAALTAGMAGAASTASAAMPAASALGAKIQTTAPAAKDGAVQQVGYFVRYRKCVRYFRWYYNPYYGRYFKRYVGRRCYFYRRYVY